MGLSLPSFVTTDALLTASSRLLDLECRELWRRFRPFTARDGASLAAAVDALLVEGTPDTAKVRHWCHVTKAILRGYHRGVEPPAADLAHFRIDRIGPERLTQLHALRLLEALAAARLGAARAPVEVFVDEVPGPIEWDFGPAGRLRVATGSVGAFRLRVSEDGLLLDGGGHLPLAECTTVGGKRLRFDGGYTHEPSIVLRAGFDLHLPVHERGLGDPCAASVPVVRHPAACAAWLPTLARALELTALADVDLTRECARYAPEVLPLYHGLGQRFASASNPDVLAYVYLPAIDTPLDVAECFVHEAMHQKLFRLEQTTRLFEPDSPSGEIFYSPWRTDSRPLRMVLHGCYVFTFVVHLWARWAELPLPELDGTSSPTEIAFQRASEVLAGIALLRALRGAHLGRHRAPRGDRVDGASAPRPARRVRGCPPAHSRRHCGAPRAARGEEPVFGAHSS